MHLCMYVCTHTHTHTHTYIGMRSFDDDDQRDITQDEDSIDMYRDIYTLNHSGSQHTHTHVYIYIYVYICIYIYTHTHTYRHALF